MKLIKRVKKINAPVEKPMFIDLPAKSFRSKYRENFVNFSDREDLTEQEIKQDFIVNKK